MDIRPETLATWFLRSLSPEPQPRRAAEASLSSSAELPGFSTALLQLVAAPAVDDQIRLAAAVYFKNHLRFRWAPYAYDTASAISAPEKELIKTHLVAFMLNAPPRLVDSLRRAAAADDYHTVNGLLGAATSLFSKFRISFDNNALRLDLKYCLDGFAAPLLEIFLNTSRLISSNVTGPPETLRPLFESLRLCSEIFHSLNSIELPEII
ncbi:hypothetical protein ZIOFF_037372 [Zingiber officinale]|uniref:Importin N-terminal domain-containing protein n=1 Tax=Zingiber officinale TaxID=94328 RepID=A0A8J5GJG8_ZINOF|nr:hypothetical protein ZIOFF_037372 [Zingiber officinale]